MAEIQRIGVADARTKVQAKAALHICAYLDDARWNRARLDGAIPLVSLEARAATLPKSQELIFYCG